MHVGSLTKLCSLKSLCGFVYLMTGVYEKKKCIIFNIICFSDTKAILRRHVFRT